MTTQASLNRYAWAAGSLLTLLCGAGTAVGQQEREMDVWKADPSDLSLAVTQVAPALAVEQVAPTDSALTSTEQGRTTDLDQSFGDWREWRLEERRQAFKDTKFEFNLRSFYFDRSDFSGAEKQAWAIGGWLGVKTGYFLDHIAFGATLYTSNPIYAPDDRDGTTLLAPGQNGYTVLGEFYAELRIVKDVGVTVGAKGYDTPFINRNDTRMTPNTFEAIVLQGRTELVTSSSDAAVTDDGIGPSRASVSRVSIAASTSSCPARSRFLLRLPAAPGGLPTGKIRAAAIPRIRVFRFKTSIGPVRARFFFGAVMTFPGSTG